MVRDVLCCGSMLCRLILLAYRIRLPNFRYHWLKSYSWRNPSHVLALNLGGLRCCDGIQWGMLGKFGIVDVGVLGAVVQK
jgi:hypothetical protein